MLKRGAGGAHAFNTLTAAGAAAVRAIRAAEVAPSAGTVEGEVGTAAPQRSAPAKGGRGGAASDGGGPASASVWSTRGKRHHEWLCGILQALLVVCMPCGMRRVAHGMRHAACDPESARLDGL